MLAGFINSPLKDELKTVNIVATPTEKTVLIYTMLGTCRPCDGIIEKVKHQLPGLGWGSARSLTVNITTPAAKHDSQFLFRAELKKSREEAKKGRKNRLDGCTVSGGKVRTETKMRTPRRRRKAGQLAFVGRPPRPSRARQLKLLLETVEQERANLSRAESLLECLRIAMEYESQTTTGPYYPDVAQIAHELVRKSVNALDPIYLPSLARDKVREDFRRGHLTQLCMQFEPFSPAVASLPSAPMPGVFAWKSRVRLHRRNYSLESAGRLGKQRIEPLFGRCKKCRAENCGGSRLAQSESSGCD